MVYEIVNYDSVSTVMSANVLLMTLIGGVGVFWGPIAGAVLFTLLQSWIGLISNAWQIYVGVLFIVIVTYAPSGVAGLVLLHRPVSRAGRMGPVMLPYVRVLLPLLVGVAGFVALVELCSVLTVGAQKGQSLRVFGRAFDPSMSAPWAVAALLLAIGALLTHRAIRAFQAEWAVVSESLRRE
jgi:branched-chain amino acid transport system permease protein